MAQPTTTERDTHVGTTSMGIGQPCDVTIVAHAVRFAGGTERQLAELVSGLLRLGHHVTVIARACALPDHENLTYRRVVGPSRPFLVAYFWFMIAGSLAVRRWRRGVVQATGAVVMNRVDLIAIHYCHQVGRATPSRPTAMFRRYAQVVGWVKRMSERVCASRNRAATFVCVSNGVADEIRSHYPYITDVVTINNGVDTAAFAPGVRSPEAMALRARLSIPEGRMLAAFVGGEWERKGLRFLLEALALAPDWHAIVVGRGDERRFGDLARRLGVADAVHWHGVTSDVQVIYELADAFVLPTGYEAFALVSLEAAASGLPVIATAVNGVRELIKDGESGFLVGQDPAAIAERLNQIAADPELRMRLSRGARKAGLAFDWAETVDAHHRLYELVSSAGT